MTNEMDDTQPHATDRPDAPAPEAGFPSRPAVETPFPSEAAPEAPAAVPLPPGAPDPEPALRVDPDRPADSGWREPAWFPPRDRDRRPSTFAIVAGLVLIALGVWFFLDRTLGVDLPRIQWSSVWPIILIVVGGLILLRSFQRKA